MQLSVRLSEGQNDASKFALCFRCLPVYGGGKFQYRFRSVTSYSLLASLHSSRCICSHSAGVVLFLMVMVVTTVVVIPLVDLAVAVVVAVLAVVKVNRRDWLGNPANIKRANKDAKIHVGRSTTLHNLLFSPHTLCMSYVTNTFLLVSSSVRSKQLLCFVQGQG